MIEDDLCCLYLYMLFLWQTYYTYTTMLCGLVEMFSINHYDFLKVTEFGTFFYISILHSRSWFLFMYQWHASAQIFPNGVFFWGVATIVLGLTPSILTYFTLLIQPSLEHQPFDDSPYWRILSSSQVVLE